MRRKGFQLHMGDLVCMNIRKFQGGSKTQKLKQLKPRYIGLYPSVEQIGTVACGYFISSVSDFHDVVHVSALKKVEGEPELYCSRRQITAGKLYAPYQL